MAEEGQRVLGWRGVPTDSSPLGPTARSVEPAIEQVFIGRGPGCPTGPPSSASSTSSASGPSTRCASSEIGERKYFYLPSLSANTLVYKGMLSADQIEGMFPDLMDPLVESALALVH